jgi:peptidylprolyl isomerase
MKGLVVSLLFVTVVVSLAACGGGATPAPTAAPTTAALTTAAPTVAPAENSSAQATAAPTVVVPKATPIVPLDDPKVQKTATGLKYADVVAGTGATPGSGDWVTVDFTATLQDGTLIGSSRLRGAPATIPLTDLAKEVPGWAEGMSTMKVGGTREIIVPPELAYGTKGAGNVIPPNATLIFLVDMLNTKPAPKVEITDLVVGTGAEATSGMNLKVNYTGTLTNGTVIDASSGMSPTEIVLSAGQVMPGWEQGLPGMKVGGTRVLTIPADLAYGTQGSAQVPPNSTLIYKFELLDVQSPPQVKIEDIQVGTGTAAASGTTITVNYTGTLTDGTVFDSSYQRNQPYTLQLGAGQVIPGWEQGLEGMKVGGKRKLTIPPSLGYGAQGAGNVIPPNATLIFEIELLDVK